MKNIRVVTGIKNIRMIIGSADIFDRKFFENIEGSDVNIDAFQEANPDALTMTLSEFMDAWNNEEITELNNWLTYVIAKEIK